MPWVLTAQKYFISTCADAAYMRKSVDANYFEMLKGVQYHYCTAIEFSRRREAEAFQMRHALFETHLVHIKSKRKGEI